MEGPSVVAYKAASGFLLDGVELVADDAWSHPALGNWNVIELVGHASRAYTTVEQYLLHPVPAEPKESMYFSADSIAQRGREAVEALGSDPKRVIAEGARRVIGLIELTPGDATLGSPVRTMTLGEYLPSRTAELTIHGLDLVRAIGAELAPPAEALEVSLAFVARLSARQGSGETVLLALSGRVPLPSGFSIY